MSVTININKQPNKSLLFKDLKYGDFFFFEDSSFEKNQLNLKIDDEHSAYIEVSSGFSNLATSARTKVILADVTINVTVVK